MRIYVLSGGIGFDCLGCLKLEEKVGAYNLIKVDLTCIGYSKMKVPRDRIVLIFRKVGPYLVPIFQKLGPYLVLNKDFHF